VNRCWCSKCFSEGFWQSNCNQKGEGPKQQPDPLYCTHSDRMNMGNHTSKRQHSNITGLNPNERFIIGAKWSRPNLYRHGSYSEPEGPKLIAQISKDPRQHKLPLFQYVHQQSNNYSVNDWAPKTDHSSCMSKHFSNFTGLQHRSLLSTWLSPDSRASHPLVTNATEEISN